MVCRVGGLGGRDGRKRGKADAASRLLACEIGLFLTRVVGLQRVFGRVAVIFPGPVARAVGVASIAGDTFGGDPCRTR